MMNSDVEILKFRSLERKNLGKHPKPRKRERKRKRELQAKDTGSCLRRGSGRGPALHPARQTPEGACVPVFAILC